MWAEIRSKFGQACFAPKPQKDLSQHFCTPRRPPFSKVPLNLPGWSAWRCGWLPMCCKPRRGWDGVAVPIALTRRRQLYAGEGEYANWPFKCKRTPIFQYIFVYDSPKPKHTYDSKSKSFFVHVSISMKFHLSTFPQFHLCPLLSTFPIIAISFGT